MTLSSTCVTLAVRLSWRYAKPIQMEHCAPSHLCHSWNQVVYGINVLPKDDPYIETAEKALAGLNIAGNPGAFLVDVLPICMLTNIAPGPHSVSLTFCSKARAGMVSRC